MMSNKPRIYGYCPAGCKWETVHKDDFMRSATFYEIGQNEVTAEAYRKYRIFADKNENTAKYKATIEFRSPDVHGDEFYTQATFTIDAGYRDYFDFEIMLARYVSTGADTAQLQLIYEVNGEQKSYTQQVQNLDLTKSVIKITGANQILLYNDTATILGKDGGYYTLNLTDNGDGTATMSFNASEEGMPTIDPVTFKITNGKDGKSAYEIYLDNGGFLTEKGWVESLKGKDGKSAYEIAVDNGFVGDETDFMIALKGENGDNGGYYTPSVNSVTANTFKISFTASKSGMPSIGDVTITLPTAKDGQDGQDGTNGADGVGVESVVQTTTSTADGGENVITITLTNGNKSTFKVKNGSKGSAGKDGTNGTSVTVSNVTESTESGGSNVVGFSDGNTLTVKNGKDGKNGIDGKDGDPYTLTPADKSEIVQAVIESLGGQPVAGYVDSDNSIVLTSPFEDGDYTIKYVMGDNTYTLGTVTVKTTTNKYTVTFVADGATVRVVEYEEGATSLDPNDVPSVPAKDGFTGAWEEYTLDGNITVNAVYTEVKVEPTNILTSGAYDVRLDQRWSNTNGGFTSGNGMVSLVIPIADCLNKTIYFKGFAKGVNANGKGPIWMTIKDNARVAVLASTDTTGNIWAAKNLITVDETNKIYGIKVDSSNFNSLSVSSVDGIAINLAVKSSGSIGSALPDGFIMTIGEPIE